MRRRAGGASAAPAPTHRLIPARFPPIGLFDTVSSAADLAAVKELAGWTDDRIVAERLARLPQAEWVHGRANASVVMAAFLHVVLGGSRFNAADLGAWYAAASLPTSVAEVAHHLRREAVARGIAHSVRTYCRYSAALAGRYLDIRGQSRRRGRMSMTRCATRRRRHSARRYAPPEVPAS